MAAGHRGGARTARAGGAGPGDVYARTAQLRRADRRTVSNGARLGVDHGGERMSAGGSLAGPLRLLSLTTMAREHEDFLG